MDADTRQDNGDMSAPVPFVPFSREETTLAVLPFFALDHKDRRRTFHISYETRLAGLDVNATLRWRVSADPVYGYPDAFDRRVFKIIEHLAMQIGLPIRNPFRFSLRQVLQLLGLAPFPTHFARVRSSLRRIAAVTVHSDLTFLTEQRTGRALQTFHVYDTVSFQEELSDEQIGNGRHRISFGAWYLENLNQQHQIPIDLPYFRSLHNPIASRLYEVLSVKFEDVLHRSLSGWRVSYPVLCRILPIQQVFRSPQRQLENAHADLLKSGFLEEVTWEKINGVWMILYMPGNRSRSLLRTLRPDDAVPQRRKTQTQEPPPPDIPAPRRLADRHRTIPDRETIDLELLHYWTLTERPFDTTPNPKFYYESSQHREALFKLRHAVAPYTGAMLLTGEVGSGKTLLTRAFVHALDQEQYDVALLTNPRWNGVELLREILYQFGQEVETADKTRILRLIEDRWFSAYQAGRHTILIIDEAQLIENFETFEELRLLLNFQMDDRYLVTLILVGQPELNAQISAIPQFEQRMAYRHHIRSLSDMETREYIRHRLEVAGTTREIFIREAATRIFKWSQGIPRRINTLCNMCLVTGIIHKSDTIDETIVDLAAGSYTPSPS